MEAKTAVFGAASVLAVDPRITRRLASALASALFAGLLLAALVLIVRRAAGGLSNPLPGAALAVTGVIAAVVTAVGRWLSHHDESWASAILVRRVVLCLPSFAIIVLAAAVTLPASSHVGLVLLWIAIAAEEAWAWRQWRRASGSSTIGPARIPARRSAPTEEQRAEPAIPHRFIAAPLSPSGDVTQRLIRMSSAAGVERIEGWLKAIAQPGERTMHLHVAFCPPFERVPQFTVIQSSGPAVRVRPVQLLPYGIRLELKLNEPNSDRSAIVVEFSAECAMTNARDEGGRMKDE